jgi:putative oxygen-independent coproporphyrinogen III oxidase
MHIPTSLYIHIPWCIKKCPYCDFNSHQKNEDMNEIQYVDCLLRDIDIDARNFTRSTCHSIFIGGGTPSLFTADAYERLFAGLKKVINWHPEMEITIEANPGTLELGRFKEFYDVGINRLSIGVQSFQDKFLKRLGRIHDGKMAQLAIETAQQAGFDRINLDLMYGLPGQRVEDALLDLKTALAWQTEHLSWYELTIEPNTVFYKRPPEQPKDEIFEQIEQAGYTLLKDAGFERYEVSAFAKHQGYAQHNLNYWLFGDYFGIGAGAHGKLTLTPGEYFRTAKVRQPKSYMQSQDVFMAEQKYIDNASEICFEFMLNATRLLHPISKTIFQERTGLPIEHLQPFLEMAAQKGWIELREHEWQNTQLGLKYNNEWLQMFLE